MRNVLVVAPHPDDEVLGCGGTIARHVLNGDRVYLCVVTSAYSPEWPHDEIEERKAAVLAANQVLGIEKTYFLDLPTVKLDTIPAGTLYRRFREIVAEVAPRVVYAPHAGDINDDHRVVFRAITSATRPEPNSPVRQVLSYETLSGTEWAPPLPKNAFIPNVYVDISATLELKMKAVQQYTRELKQFPHPRSLEAIAALAAFRGSTIGAKAAEAFMLIREIWS